MAHQSSIGNPGWPWRR